ncbi:cellulose synthase/poly-beta-1,6-N-acetylglucosamine synthase-like glycosyltransferase [Janthinobacterium sp. CG_23.3]|uniref:glycosyltransferase family 2 protein n=1 Tax=unclassified Janthinobacterium TaxID=2610881 RepID=UPI000364EB38|nr:MULTISPECIES: glycosyltransferase family 2 protein [unclassified Janthinobacterium]MEC5161188.1 cellulose synthase/poly-beta-1,6-N-acetylglucosamine synthase-like glycosyltransferase [Janthinobacterium sp. CG_S6]
MKTVFWTSLFLIVYPYLVYPLVMLAIGKMRPRKVARAPCLPTMTILIPAYNEVAMIGATIQNKLDQGYPADRLQIIVISDGSADGTDDVVKGFGRHAVKLLRRERREGKAAALNEAVRLASGDIIIFSDANTLFGANALQRIAANFADPEIGYLTGSLQFVTDGGNASGAGARAYMRYENLVRGIETAAGSIIGVNGGVDAIRRRLYVDTPPALITDLILPLSVIAGGHRVIFDPQIDAFETPNTDVSCEFRMRVRVALRALQGLTYMRKLLNPLHYPLVSFSLFSHKVLRYLGFVFMPAALASNIALAPTQALYRVLLVLQLGVYCLAALGLMHNLPGWLRKITTVPSYFALSNAAFAVAAYRFLRGDTLAVWQPRAG